MFFNYSCFNPKKIKENITWEIKDERCKNDKFIILEHFRLQKNFSTLMIFFWGTRFYNVLLSLVIWYALRLIESFYKKMSKSYQNFHWKRQQFCHRNVWNMVLFTIVMCCDLVYVSFIMKDWRPTFREHFVKVAAVGMPP